jgi:heat shock protein HspQ
MIKNKIIEVKKNRKLKVKDYAGMVFSINPNYLNDEKHAYNVIEPIHQNSVRQKRDVKLFWEEKNEFIF